MALSESEELELLELEELESQSTPVQQPKEYSQGLFKTYEGQPQGMAQKADVLAGKAANFGMEALSAPFELAGESLRTGVEGLAGRKAKFQAPRLFGGQGGQDPFGYANKLTRTGVAGLTAPLRGQEMGQQAQAEYDRPQSGIDTAADIATGIGSSFVAPRIANAPVEALTQGASKLFQGASKLSGPIRENIVAPNARRALGKFPASMPTQEANRVGLTALDQGVITNPITHPFSSGRPAQLERATTLNESIGENIGNFLKGQGEGLDTSRAIRELDAVKAQFMNDPVIVRKVNQAKQLIEKNSSTGKPDLRVALNLRGKTYVGNPGEIHVNLVDRVAKELGVSPDQIYDDVNKIGDMGFSDRGRFLTRSEASQATGGSRPEAASLLAEGKMSKDIPEEVSPTMGFSEANKLKGLFQKKVNYGSDAATQESGKAIAKTFRGSIDQQLDELSAKLGNKEGMESFKANKKMFGKTRVMEDVLEKQAKRDERNMPVSLPSVGIGIGGLIQSGGIKGITLALASEWVKKYGNAAAASMINDVARAAESAGKAGKSIESSAKVLAPAGVASTESNKILKKRTLDKKTAAKYLDLAGGDPDKALELAEKDGY